MDFKNESLTAEQGQYLTFFLKSQSYGVPIAAVREINQLSDIVQIPKTPSFVMGVMNLRGKVIPVVDLRMKFGMGKTPHTKETCIIVIETELGQVGAVVDAVSEVVDLTAEQIGPPPILGEEKELAFVKGIGKLNETVIVLVDVVNALSREEFTRIQSARELAKAAEAA